MADFTLHAPQGANKKPKRVGRGSSSGLGSTAGKGNKGQQSRSGSAVPYVGFEGGQMPLYRRIARRGFSNAAFKKVYAVFNVSLLNEKYSDGETVDVATLTSKGLLKKMFDGIKILGNGDISKKLTIIADKISASAKEKIEKAGGTVTLKEAGVKKETASEEK